MIRAERRWLSIDFFAYRSGEFEKFEPDLNARLSTLLRGRDGHGADPKVVLAELDFMERSCSIAGIDVFNINEQKPLDSDGFPQYYESGDIYALVSEYDHMVFWTAPSGRLVVVFFTGDPGTLLSMSDQLTKVSAINIELA